jgi:hypothetical protein
MRKEGLGITRRTKRRNIYILAKKSGGDKLISAHCLQIAEKSSVLFFNIQISRISAADHIPEIA